MQLLGLTGGIASGKTIASDFLQAKGLPIIDADVLARKVIDQGSPAYHTILNRHPECLSPQGHIDRAKLRTIIFTHKSEREWLENLLHPLIYQAILQSIAGLKHPGVVVLPLLNTSPYVYPLTHVLVIKAPLHMRITRIIARDSCSVRTAMAIIKTQSHFLKYPAIKVTTINNNQSVAVLMAKLAQFYQTFFSGTTP
jgi:dephospho-CoA kinase